MHAHLIETSIATMVASDLRDARGGRFAWVRVSTTNTVPNMQPL